MGSYWSILYCLTVLPYCLFTVIIVAVTYSGQISDDDDEIILTTRRDSLSLFLSIFIQLIELKSDQPSRSPHTRLLDPRPQSVMQGKQCRYVSDTGLDTYLGLDKCDLPLILIDDVVASDLQKCCRNNITTKRRTIRANSMTATLNSN